jgi:hypothetical protein
LKPKEDDVATDTEYQGTGGKNGDGEVFEHAKRAVEEAKAFGSAVSGSMENLGRTLDLRGRVERHPIGMMFAALGVGYVLGGGLFSPLTGRLVRVGMRLALVPLIKSQLGVLTGSGGESERPPGSDAI